MADESKYPTRIAPYGLRMPDDLKARIQAAAEAANRSMNAEIVATLETAYPEPKGKADEITREYMYLAGVALADDTPPGTRAKAVTRMNELERAYRELTGERL